MGAMGELDFGLLGGERGFAAFQDVFLAGARGLDHLVNGAVAFGEIFVGKAEGEVVDHLGFLEGVEPLAIAARRKQAVGQMGRMAIMGRILPTILIIRIIPIFSHCSVRMPAGTLGVAEVIGRGRNRNCKAVAFNRERIEKGGAGPPPRARMITGFARDRSAAGHLAGSGR
jgi:hypothetical protein